MRLTTYSGATQPDWVDDAPALAAGVLVAMFLAMRSPHGGPPWRGHHRAFPEGDWEFAYAD